MDKKLWKDMELEINNLDVISDVIIFSAKNKTPKYENVMSGVKSDKLRDVIRKDKRFIIMLKDSKMPFGGFYLKHDKKNDKLLITECHFKKTLAGYKWVPSKIGYVSRDSYDHDWVSVIPDYYSDICGQALVSSKCGEKRTKTDDWNWTLDVLLDYYSNLFGQTFDTYDYMEKELLHTVVPLDYFERRESLTYYACNLPVGAKDVMYKFFGGAFIPDGRADERVITYRNTKQILLAIKMAATYKHNTIINIGTENIKLKEPDAQMVDKIKELYDERLKNKAGDIDYFMIDDTDMPIAYIEQAGDEYVLRLFKCMYNYESPIEESDIDVFEYKRVLLKKYSGYKKSDLLAHIICKDNEEDKMKALASL